VPPAIGFSIPAAARAIIARSKLEGYVLDPEHGDGRHKARVFRATLGIESADWRYLYDAILAGLAEAPVSAVEETPYGSRCTVVMPLLGLNGRRHDVVTAWLVEKDQPPRLITAYVDL
jgi:hypothetical protein